MSVVVPEQMVVFADPAWRADLGLLAESSRIAARGFAADAFLLSDLADRVPEPTGTRDGELAWQAFVREVALARGLQERAAAREIAIARLLARHLPRTVELLACGTLLLPRAVAFVDELVGVDPATVRQVDRMLAERLPSMAPGRIRLEVRRAVDRIDADAAADRAAKAAAGRAVRVRADQDGQASAYLNGPAVPMTRWFQALTETARALQVAGDPRGLDALRFDLVMGGFALDEPPAAPPLPAQAVGVPAEDEEDIPEALRPAPGATPQPLPTGSPQPQPQSPPWPEEQLQLQPEGVAVDDPDAPGTSPWQPVSLEITLAQQRALDEAPAAAVPPDDDPPVVCDALVRASREQAARVLEQARERAERVLEAAHAAEAESLHRLAQIRAEHDRLLALVVRERLCVSSTLPSDRRASRPVQVLVHVPVTTALA